MNPLTHHRRNRRLSAFTLIELLVVILILAILAALIVPKFINQADDAKRTKATTDLAELSKLVENFRLDQGRYPTTEEGLDILYSNTSNIDNWRQYTTKPIPPDPYGHPYIYTYPGSSGENSYFLGSYGSDGVAGGEGNAADIIEAE